MHGGGIFAAAGLMRDRHLEAGVRREAGGAELRKDRGRFRRSQPRITLIARAQLSPKR